MRVQSSAMLISPRPFSKETCIVTGVDYTPKTKRFTMPLTCRIKELIFTQVFLVLPECPTAVKLRGRKSWIHMSRIKPVPLETLQNQGSKVRNKPPNADKTCEHYSCEPLENLKMLLKKRLSQHKFIFVIFPYNYYLLCLSRLKDVNLFVY